MVMPRSAAEAIMFALCLSRCLSVTRLRVPCQRGLVHSATHMNQRWHHMTARGLKLSG